MADKKQQAPMPTSEPGGPDDYEALLDARMMALGEEMRPQADLIMQLKEDLKQKSGGERSKLKNLIHKLERTFVDCFNRDDAFERYQWPDGLVVEFTWPGLVNVAEPLAHHGEEGGSAPADKAGRHRAPHANSPERVIAPAPGTQVDDTQNLQIGRSRWPVFSWALCHAEPQK